MTAARIAHERNVLSPAGRPLAGAARQDELVSLIASAVAYDGLPISSGGAHRLRRLSARQAFAAWRDFLNARTSDSTFNGYFELAHRPDLTVDPAAERRVLAAFPGPIVQARVTEALDLFADLEPQPTNRGLAAVELSFRSEFQIHRPGTSEVWLGQEHERFGDFETPAGMRLGVSGSSLRLAARFTMSLQLTLPEASDSDVAEAVPWLEAALPMRLSQKHWTRWTLTKNGKSYRGKRLVLSV